MTVVGVIGYGVVGQAITEVFSNKGFLVLFNDTDVEKHKLSSLGRHVTKEEIAAESDYIFICVSTPTYADGSMNLQHVSTAWSELWTKLAIFRRDNPPIVIMKSTVLPGTVETYAKGYPNFISNPEFLRQNHPTEDFENPDRIILGGDLNLCYKVEKDLYADWVKRDIKTYMVSATEAELIKLLSNAFLVNKVAYSQLIEKVTRMYAADPMEVYIGLTLDSRINASHLNPFGKRGDGPPKHGPLIPSDGPCLAKDLRALVRGIEHRGWMAPTGFLREMYRWAVSR